MCACGSSVRVCTIFFSYPDYRLREAGVTESAARDLARQPAPVPEDPDRAFDAPESG